MRSLDLISIGIRKIIIIKMIIIIIIIIIIKGSETTRIQITNKKIKQTSVKTKKYIYKKIDT